MINEPPPLNREYNRDPNIKALKRRGFINHGSTLCQVRVEDWDARLDSGVYEVHGIRVPDPIRVYHVTH